MTKKAFEHLFTFTTCNVPRKKPAKRRPIPRTAKPTLEQLVALANASAYIPNR